jgi:hypothetical protein
MDYFLQQQITGLQGSVRDAAVSASDATRQVLQLQETVDRLVLATQAMWALLGQQSGLGESELLEKIREIDLLDGTLDGRVRRNAKTCPSCARQNGPRRTRCIYCAKPLPEAAFS